MLSKDAPDIGIDLAEFPVKPEPGYPAGYLVQNLNVCSNTSSNKPDIRLILVPGIRPDIRQVKSGTGISPNPGIKKRPNDPAGYPVHP
jgi:hypothetical protein